MKTFHRIATILLLLAAPAALARVLSYAPYSEKFATRAQQSRTTRHVLVNEGTRLMLYDSKGIDEPQVVSTGEGLDFAALFQANDDAKPLIYYRSKSSLPANMQWPADRGGPLSRGLNAPIIIGNAQYPFITYSSSSGDVIAIAPNDEVKTLAAWPARIIGRNREGNRILVTANGTVSIVELDGRTAPVAKDLSPAWGWITSEGAVYTVTPTPTGVLRIRFHEHQQETFKTGRDGFFAIPTADFEGAWMVQQGPGDPTTLSRYYPGRGEEVMWTDERGRQIEALIPGASGETLLIQAQRPRGAADTPFTGVSLALWRTGEPAPADYDDLLARLGTHYGFAHVDPDTLAAGSPFVFDTAFDGTFKRDRLAGVGSSTGGGADVIQEWGVVRGTIKQRVVLPTVSRIQGGYSTNWLTDVTLYNPLATKQDVNLRFESTTKTLSLEPKEIRVVRDVLQTVFGIERGAGPLFVEPQKSMTVTSRTYTPSGNGSLGYSMDAIDASNTAGAGYQFTFGGAFPKWHFRTNMLLTDLSGRGSEAVLHGFTTQVPVGVAPNSTVNLGRVDPWLGTRGGLRVEAASGNLMTTVVAIDNFTNDATYFPPDLLMNPRMSRTLPALAHIDFPDGSKLRSDVYIYNASPSFTHIFFEGKELDNNGWPRLIRGISLSPWQAHIFEEAPDFLMRLRGRSRLRYSAGEGVRVTARTYFIDPDGGTRGMIAPPLNNFQMAAEGETLELVAQAGSNLRMSLAVMDLAIEPVGDPSVVRIHLIDDKGKTLHSFDETVHAAQGRYFEDIFKAHGIEQPAATRIVVEIVRSPSLVGAYGVLREAVTGDLAYVSANHGGRP
jgi:hypothetical protein